MHELARLPLFPSPTTICTAILDPAAQAAALAWILAERDQHLGLVRSNIGGWHSLPDLLHRPAPPLQPLWSAVLEAIHRHHRSLMPPDRPLGPLPVQLQAWAMVMEHGDYTLLHDHPEATWSGVYYLDAGDTPPEHPTSGQLTLCSPLGGRHHTGDLPDLQATFTFTPVTDQLILFPGWLQHYVHPYRGSRPRVAVAFNAVVHS